MPDPRAVSIRFSNLGHFYTHLFLLLYPTVVLALEKEFSIPYGELLSLSLAGFILSGAGAIPAGWLGDRWSYTGMMAVFFFGIGGSAILAGLATSPFQIGAALALIGLFASIYHPVGVALLVNNTTTRGRTLGINGVFGNFGTALAPLVAGLAVDLINWRVAYLIPGAVAILTGAVYLRLTRAVAPMEPLAVTAPVPGNARGDLVRVMVVLSVALLCAGLIYQATAVALPKVFSLRLTDSPLGGATGIGAMVTLVYLVASGSQIITGHLADRFPLKKFYILIYVVQVPIFALATRLFGWPLLLATTATVMLNVGAAPVESSLIAQYSSAKWRATAFGAKFAISLGVSALGIPLVAFIFETTGGFSWLFAVLAGLAGTTAFAGLFLPSERKSREPVPLGVEPVPVGFQPNER